MACRCSFAPICISCHVRAKHSQTVGRQRGGDSDRNGSSSCDRRNSSATDRGAASRRGRAAAGRIVLCGPRSALRTARAEDRATRSQRTPGLGVAFASQHPTRCNARLETAAATAAAVPANWEPGRFHVSKTRTALVPSRRLGRVHGRDWQRRGAPPLRLSAGHGRAPRPYRAGSAPDRPHAESLGRRPCPWLSRSDAGLTGPTRLPSAG